MVIRSHSERRQGAQTHTFAARPYLLLPPRSDVEDVQRTPKGHHPPPRPAHVPRPKLTFLREKKTSSFLFPWGCSPALPRRARKRHGHGAADTSDTPTCPSPQADKRTGISEQSQAERQVGKPEFKPRYRCFLQSLRANSQVFISNYKSPTHEGQPLALFWHPPSRLSSYHCAGRRDQ